MNVAALRTHLRGARHRRASPAHVSVLAWLAAGFAACTPGHAPNHPAPWNRQAYVREQLAPAALRAVALAAGDEHTCALLSDGSVRCWGSRRTGGRGDVPPGPGASPVPGLTGVVHVAAGSGRTCAATDEGAVLCWGAGDERDAAAHRTPARVAGIEHAVELALSQWDVCARLEDGAVRCARHDAAAQGPAPITVIAGGALELVAGSYHFCARMRNEEVLCWGENAAGQLGNDAHEASARPVRAHVDGVVALFAADAGTCAQRADGSAWCWGLAPWGGSSAEPVDVSAFIGDLATGAVRAVASLHALCASYEDGAVRCGDHERTAPIPSLHDVTELVAGHFHFCALTRAGKVSCWGSNSDDELGAGDVSEPLPFAVPTAELGPAASFDSATALVASGDRTCALVPSHGLVCWGGASVGAGALAPWRAPAIALRPALIAWPAVERAALGFEHVCASAPGGSLRCAHVDGSDPWHVDLRAGAAPLAIDALATSGGTACAVVDDGTLRCFLLGVAGDADARPMRPPVPGFDGARALLASGHRWFARFADGSVRVDSCYLSACLDAPFASQVAPELAGAAELAIGGRLACLRLHDGSVRCGEHGAATLDPIAGLEDAAALAVGSDHVCALTSRGTVACWGWNEHGELGDGSYTSRAGPRDPARPVTGIEGAIAVAAGDHHSCALLGGGRVRCWGDARAGQMGDGRYRMYAYEPLPVAGLP